MTHTISTLHSSIICSLTQICSFFMLTFSRKSFPFSIFLFFLSMTSECCNQLWKLHETSKHPRAERKRKFESSKKLRQHRHSHQISFARWLKRTWKFRTCFLLTFSGDFSPCFVVVLWVFVKKICENFGFYVEIWIKSENKLRFSGKEWIGEVKNGKKRWIKWWKCKNRKNDRVKKWLWKKSVRKAFFWSGIFLMLEYF